MIYRGKRNERSMEMLLSFLESSKFISDWPTGAYRIQQQNIQGSTQIAPLAVTSGGEQISESSNKLRYGHLRHDGIRSKHHHPGTMTEFHWPLFLISSHIGVGWGYGQNDHNIQKKKRWESIVSRRSVMKC